MISDTMEEFLRNEYVYYVSCGIALGVITVMTVGLVVCAVSSLLNIIKK